jgi:hypothetical protein
LRALPLFFALDQFKASQERDARGKDYTMAPLAGALPSPDRAVGELTAAMEAWDEERAERAVAVLARTRGAAEVFELLWRYGVRDYRNIGHKAIFLSNACRTLHTIGWQHGETVLRSLVLGLLDFGKETKVNGFALEDQTYSHNARRPGQAWTTGPAEVGDTMAVLAAIRDNTPVKACDEVAARMAKGLTPASVWDAVHLAAAELTMRTAGGGIITGIHSVSAANAMHYAWQTAADGRTRLLILQQAVGWMGQFRIWAEMGKGIRSMHVDDVPHSEKSFVEIFERAKTVDGRRQYVAETLRHVIPKANEVHYYKFPAALIEDIPLVSPRWQPHLAATISYYTKGPTDVETAPMKRALEG